MRMKSTFDCMACVSRDAHIPVYDIVLTMLISRGAETTFYSLIRTCTRSGPIHRVSKNMQPTLCPHLSEVLIVFFHWQTPRKICD